MLVKYDVMVYKGKENLIFMFKMDHEIEFVEKFVSDFFDIKSCRRIKPLNGMSVSTDLDGKYYDCNNINRQCTRPLLIFENNRICILGENFTLEFRLDTYNLFMIDLRELVDTIRDSDKYTYNLVFCSSKDIWNKTRFIGEVFAIDGKISN